jgi:hypothetical protein
MADEVVLYPSGGVQRSVVAVAFPRGARHDVADCVAVLRTPLARSMAA